MAKFDKGTAALLSSLLFLNGGILQSTRAQPSQPESSHSSPSTNSQATSNLIKTGLPNLTSTLPSDTDSGITKYNDPNLSWLPYEEPRNELLVFLTGTGGKPSRSKFLETAAHLGYHVISLMYPCDIAAQQACPNSDDPDAYMKFRLEIIQGKDLSDAVNVSRTDSIENRLEKLNKYLAVHQPGQGWDQYLAANGEPNWSKIGFCGQSQGGGHAAIIAKVHEVARVIMFGSPKDYSFRLKRPAKGFDSDTKTPLNRYFAFNHIEDTKGACDHQQQMEIFQQMGLTALGVADADHPTANYNHAHLIFTDGQLPDMTQMPRIHNFAINNMTVLSSNGQLICPPVWKYMLTEPVK